MYKSFQKSVVLTLALLSGYSGMQAYGETDPGLKRKSSPGVALTSNELRKNSPQMKPMAAVSEDQNVFRASVLYTDSWETNGSYEFGIYQFPTSGSYSSTPVYCNPSFDATAGATLIGDGRYFWTQYTQMYGYTFLDHFIAPIDDWASFERFTGNELAISRELAWDHVTETLYGCFRGEDGSGWALATIDPDNLEAKPVFIAKLDERWNAMSFDRVGRLYAITESGKLCSVDKYTGKVTEIGDTGLLSRYNTCGAINFADNKFYFVPVNDEHAYLYTIDLATAEVTPLYMMEDGEQLAGMYFPVASPDDAAPAKAKGVNVTVDHATMTGQVTFTAPATTFGGQTLQGELGYKVLANDKLVAEGKTSAGASVTADIAVSDAGDYAFEVVIDNAAGKSESAWATAYVGADAPAAVERVDMLTIGDRIILSWTPVTTSAHGGAINPDDVTYTITRYPDGKVVDRSTRVTNFTETIEAGDPIMLYYTVTPENGSHIGVPTKSSEKLYGAFTPPYSADFTKDEDFKYLTIVDANDDGRAFVRSLDDDDEICLYLYPNSIRNGDDYIYSAPVSLKKGTLYRMNAVAGPRYAKYGCKDMLDLVVASSTDPNDAKNIILENAEVSQVRQEFSATFKVETDGTYYIAIHGCGSPDAFGLYAYSMGVTADASDDAPAASEVSAVADGKNITVRVVTPSTLINGEACESLTELEIQRNGETVFTQNTPEAGAEIVFTDENLNDGLYVYNIYASNGAGKGEMAEARAFVGINVPGAPANAVARELEDCRSVEMTWTAPTVDVDGCAIDPSVITYTVASYDDATMKWIPMVSGVKGTTTSFTALADGTQILAKFAVFAETSAGKNSNDFATAPVIAIGDPYKMPYVETFGGTSLSGVLAEDNENDGSSWQVMYNYDQDGTGGSLFYSGAIDKRGSVLTGKIKVEGENPTFSFWFWSIPTSPEGEQIIVEANDGTGFKEIGTVALNQGGETQHWERFVASVADYVGKPVQFKITYCLKKYVLYIDNIRLTDTYSNNLTAHEIAGYTHVTPDYPLVYFAEIENTGENTSEPYSVKLSYDDIVLDITDMPALAPGERVYAEFYVDFDFSTPEEISLVATIEEDGDENDDDNVTPTFPVVVIYADVPVVNDLTGTRRGDDVVLNWSAPACGDEAEKITEGADLLIPFSTGLSTTQLGNDNIGDWTMINADNQGSAGLLGFEHPNIFKEADLSFVVWNPSLLGIVVPSWQPRSGLQSFICLCAPDANDDWMVCPMLSGNAQEISFYARSTGEQYTESFEFCYSTTGKNVEDFQTVEAIAKVPCEWTRYAYSVPAGTKYFAIRYTSVRQIALLVDDIEFERANPNFGTTPESYSIYRDNVFVTSTADTEYVDSNITEGASYKVSATYSRGVSKCSNEVFVDRTTGIGTVDANTTAVKVETGQGYADIYAPAGEKVAVVSVDGRVIESFKVRSGETRVNLAQGFYVITVGTESFKVMVD